MPEPGWLGQPLQRPVAEGSAACGQDDAFNGGDILSNQRLKYRGMFAVYGQQMRVVAAGGFQHQCPGADQRFLVG